MSQLSKFTLDFSKSGYFFIALFILAILGFWPSYFAKFFDGTADFTSYFHFHSITASLWIVLLIVQPILIQKGNTQWHKRLGRFSYILIPLIYISVILLAHHRITGEESNLGISIWITFKDLFILAIAYGIAIYYRQVPAIHARGMIGAGIVLIEPALVRFIQYAFFPGPDFAPAGYLATILTVYLILILLSVFSWRHRRGRWVFPIILAAYIFVHSVIIFQIRIGIWESFVEWFASLPLT